MAWCTSTSHEDLPSATMCPHQHLLMSGHAGTWQTRITVTSQARHVISNQWQHHYFRLISNKFCMVRFDGPFVRGIHRSQGNSLMTEWFLSTTSQCWINHSHGMMMPWQGNGSLQALWNTINSAIWCGSQNHIFFPNWKNDKSGQCGLCWIVWNICHWHQVLGPLFTKRQPTLPPKISKPRDRD